VLGVLQLALVLFISIGETLWLNLRIPKKHPKRGKRHAKETASIPNGQTKVEVKVDRHQVNSIVKSRAVKANNICWSSIYL